MVVVALYDVNHCCLVVEREKDREVGEEERETERQREEREREIEREPLKLFRQRHSKHIQPHISQVLQHYLSVSKH